MKTMILNSNRLNPLVKILKNQEQMMSKTHFITKNYIQWYRYEILTQQMTGKKGKKTKTKQIKSNLFQVDKFLNQYIPFLDSHVKL